MTSHFAAALSGTPYSFESIDKVIADRYRAREWEIREGEYLYDDNRTRPENLGWRVRQNASRPAAFENKPEIILTPEGITAGEFDDLLQQTLDDAADAEYYYRYKKDWGSWECE